MSSRHWWRLDGAGIVVDRTAIKSELNANFTAHSGMEEIISNGIFRGRPFGGVSVSWSSDLDHVMRPLTNYKHRRIVCAEMMADPRSIIFASIYMPFFDSSKREECLSETVETIAMLEEIVADHPQHYFVIGGDFNAELKGNSLFDTLWTNFMQKHHLT